MPKISVILPYFNAEQTLKRSVNSILQQSFTDFELLLVNNNSTDNSFKIAKELAKKDIRIILLEEKKQGVVFASQKGFENTNSYFIARADADDFWHKNKLLFQYNFLKENPKIDVVSCRVKYVGSNKNKGMITYVKETNKLLTHNEIATNRFSELQVINPTIMFRKEIALKHGLYKEGNFPEDYEMFLRWIEAGVKYHKLSKYLLDWSDSENRLTRTDKRYSFDAFYKIKSTYLFNFLKKHNKNFPNVAIWGAGKLTKQRVNYITRLGIKIKYFIDVDENKIDGVNVISYKNIPEENKIFIVSFVNNKGAREKIKQYLLNKNYQEGADFIIA